MTKPLIKQVAHACIFAHDLDATEAFYRDVLGISTAFTFKRGEERIGYYLDLGARTFIEVFRKAESRFAETDQINHICLETEDIDALVAHLQAKGVSITDKKLGVDGTWQAWLADPNGVKMEIFQYTEESLQFKPPGSVCQVTW
ncbi:lactoylglutathione lyase/glyoxylase I family protein [Devosia sp. YR412]|uniref:VOC family protein n=1 Tax=Devosia sp. YR412 TaxID=1881030 RepID=UPI0008C86CC9|nr:VOC family protein [Devosia sp. YR412]SEQ46893.1 lactoylglutathione lyase/glyoxylase I family protein [Devosia sp. YR412]